MIQSLVKTMDTSPAEVCHQAIMSSEAWNTEPLGHTEYQLRKTMFHDVAPTEDAMYRHLILELWARWEAFTVNRYEQKKAVARLKILRAEIEELNHRMCLTPRSRAKREGEIGLREAEIELLEDGFQRLQLDQEHRILRETRILLDEFKSRHPSELPRIEAEAENWEARAKTKALKGNK